MNNLVTQRGDPGLAQAWLMATVGSKPAYRRTLKKDINDISIPRICDEVSTIAAEARHLRLTSNLLYGLSLIYKHKVTFMASDLSTVFDRISSPLFTKQILQIDSTRTFRDPTTRNTFKNLADNLCFDMNVDFLLPYPDLEDENGKLEEAFQRSLAIMGQDANECGNVDTSEIPAHIAVDAQEKLFLEFMNKTMITKEVLLEECLTVDFEFNQEGEIIGRSHNNEDANAADFLNDLNLDEDLDAVTTSIEDISKSGNQTSAEQILATLNQSRAFVSELPETVKSNKRRKLRPINDEVTTINLSKALITQTTEAPPIQHSVSDVFHALSLSQPPFLNMCYRMLFGSVTSAGMSTSMFPLSSRHPDVSNLDSFLKEMDDIERGRDIPSRRPSLSLVDEAMNMPFEIPLDETNMDADAFGIEPLSPMLEELEESEDFSNEAACKLEKFEEYLSERAKQVAERKLETVQTSTFTFESLVPSKDSPEEVCVHRNLAASALSCILQLATSGSLIILTKTPKDSHPSKPDEIYIIFN